MADILPPIPYDRPQTSFEWIDWYTKLNKLINSGAQHNNLQGLQGGTTNQYYHLTSAQQSGLTSGGFTTLHKHEAFPVDAVYSSVAYEDPAIALGYGTWVYIGSLPVSDSTSFVTVSSPSV